MHIRRITRSVIQLWVFFEQSMGREITINFNISTAIKGKKPDRAQTTQLWNRDPLHELVSMERMTLGHDFCITDRTKRDLRFDYTFYGGRASTIRVRVRSSKSHFVVCVILRPVS